MKTKSNLNISLLGFLLLGIPSLFLSLGKETSWLDHPSLLGLAVLAILVTAWGVWKLLESSQKQISRQANFAFILTVIAFLAGIPPLQMVWTVGAVGTEALGMWIYLGSHLFLVWGALGLLSNSPMTSPKQHQFVALLVPLFFGMWLLYLWEIITIGFGVPRVLLPPPSMISKVFASSTEMLWQDFYQTFVKSVLSGFIMGCGSGFLVAILADQIPFLRKGLIPLGNFVSALPIVGVAPIMVMWFGFDWESKAAVVILMTFFPMMINTLAGLNAAGKLEKELLLTYHPSAFQMFLQVRLPYALPFIFNALKINSALAIIGAIVAEFFGTPIVGMGFRISTEVGRMNIDVVWATIAISALAGSLFYGLLALLERTATFWHPSYRK